MSSPHGLRRPVAQLDGGGSGGDPPAPAVRLQPSVPIHLRDFSVTLVGEGPPQWAAFWFRKNLGLVAPSIQHAEIVLMHTNRVLRRREVLELPLERVTIPQNDLDAGNPDMRWYLKVEARLERQKVFYLQNIEFYARPVRQDVQQPRSDSEPGGPAPRDLPPLRESRVEEEQLPRTSSPVSEDIRRQLEGGIETLEATHARYTLLERALRKRQWQQAVQERMNTLRALVHQEPELEQTLARLYQRAQREEWPDTEPALRLARKVERLRSRLDALTHERLGRPTFQVSLVEKLARLHQVLAQTIAPPLSSEEGVLHQGGFEANTTMPMEPSHQLLLGLIVLISGVYGDFVLLACLGVALCLDGILRRWGLSSRLFLTIDGWKLFQRYLSGRFWLTDKRLVWKPTGRRPIHIPLHAIQPGGVRLRSDWSVEVRLMDGRSFHLDYIQGAERLVSLLEQHVPASRPEEA